MLSIGLSKTESLLTQTLANLKFRNYKSLISIFKNCQKAKQKSYRDKREHIKV